MPLALLDAAWLAGGRIVMLEPRRLAARAAAHRMAYLLGEPVGETIGYRTQLDTRVGPRTRLEVATEGVLTRMLLSDPALEGVGLVVFDEFHERSVQADLGLALCLQARALLREDLRILAMSATLDTAPVAALLGDASVLASEGRVHPVETRYLGRSERDAHEAETARAVRTALGEASGDVLVFLPGAAEIHRAALALEDGGVGRQIRVLPLYGDLPPDAQELAIRPSPAGERKIVLATSLAETSLTIEGVRVVIDSGLMRVPRFSPRTGMTRLVTVPVTRASADQRRGRAGRLGPGVCYRLWAEHEDLLLVPYGTPEIQEADLAPLALDLAVWGVHEPGELEWLNPPPSAAFFQARELLAQLGALDAEGRLTEHGRRMSRLPTHPRLANLLLRGRQLGAAGVACDLAALLDGRDIFRTDDEPRDADVRLRLDALREARSGRRSRFGSSDVHGGRLRRAQAEADYWRRRLGAPSGEDDPEAAGLLLASAYPDRVAQRRPRGGGRFRLRNGRGALLEGAQPLAEAEFLVAADLDDRGRDSRVHLAAPLDALELEQWFGEQVERETRAAWDAGAGAVRVRRIDRLGAILLRSTPVAEPNAGAVTAALLAGIRQEGLELLPWTGAARQLQQRLRFLHGLDSAWPDPSDAALLADLESWLAPFVTGLRTREQLRRLELTGPLSALLSWEQRQDLNELAPTHLRVPSGSRIPIDYSDPAAPSLAVRLQEVFGLLETPRIARGAVPLTLHLLSPAGRPVQVTRDLRSFWSTAYFDVRKDLKGRYPKHFRPDDPLTSAATRRTRPRK